MSDNMNDPLGLNINLQEVDTSRPVIVAGKYAFSVKECSRVPKKDDPNKFNLLIVFTLDQEAETVQGGTVQPGYQIRRYLPLQQSDNPNAPNFIIELVRFFDAAFDIESPEQRSTVFPDPGEFVGRALGLIVSVQEDDAMGKSNDVRGFLRLSDL